MTYRIQIDVDDYPSTFAFDEEELATVKEAHTLTDEECIRAARNCPSRAISVIGEDGVEIPT